MFLLHDYAGRTVQFRDDLPSAGLADVAATLVELLGYNQPSDFEPSLIDWPN